MPNLHFKDHEKKGLVAYGPHSVQGRKELAAWIASIAGVWSLIEHDLVLMYGWLMGQDLPRVGKTGLPQRHFVARQVFEAVHGLDSRLKLLEKLAGREGIATETERKSIAKLTPAVRAAAPKRNKIVHGLWGICPHKQCANRLILYPPSNEDRGRMYLASDFKHVYNALCELHGDLFGLAHAIQKRLHRP